MVFGIGMDCIEVARIEARVSEDSTFAGKIFTPREREYCAGRHHPAQHYAARFAAKEALFKALGTGWSGGMAFHEVEVLNDDNGRPCLVLSGAVRAFAAHHAIARMHVSLTHVRELACAVVVLETGT